MTETNGSFALYAGVRASEKFSESGHFAFHTANDREAVGNERRQSEATFESGPTTAQWF
jgi:hypothetical protein